MPHRFLAMALLATSLALASCSTPPVGNASGQDTTGKNGVAELFANYQPGTLGSSQANTKLAYERQTSNPQSAPTLQLNLQPAPGATTAASYPALTSINQIFLVTMANGHDQSPLSADQIEQIGNALGKAGVAASEILKAQAVPPPPATGTGK